MGVMIAFIFIIALGVRASDSNAVVSPVDWCCHPDEACWPDMATWEALEKSLPGIAGKKVTYPPTTTPQGVKTQVDIPVTKQVVYADQCSKLKDGTCYTDMTQL